jgi:hypothetical protein
MSLMVSRLALVLLTEDGADDQPCLELLVANLFQPSQVVLRCSERI